MEDIEETFEELNDKVDKEYNVMSSINDQKLCHFLTTLAKSIEEKTLEDSKKQLIGEFYMKYLFYQNEKKLFEDMDQEDINRFLFLGWFIYTIILCDKRIKNKL
jgi:hypothetical protein